MKKNLKIVSAAAAALLAVAPVAASAVSSVNAAAVTNIELGGTSAPAIKSDVTLSSDLKAVTKANAVLTDTTTGNTIARYNWDGKVSGSITASWAGQSYTGNLTPGESTVAVFWRNADTQSWNEVKKGSNGLYALEPGVKYYVEVPAVSFNFGTANANKKNLSLSASNGMRLISGDKFVDKINFDTDANGAMVNPKGVEVLIPVTPVDTANADVVSFFERATGTNVNSGSIDVNAVNGSINVSSIMSAFNAKYSAHQLENGANAAANVTTTVADVTAQLQKAGIKVDSLGNIADAPKTLNLTFNAKSPANGAEVSMPVTVNVPNGKVSTPTESAVTKTVNHIAAIYDKDGNQLNLAKLRA
ncbi:MULTISPECIES: S-layer protein, partial [Lactobacillus]